MAPNGWVDRGEGDVTSSDVRGSRATAMAPVLRPRGPRGDAKPPPSKKQPPGRVKTPSAALEGDTAGSAGGGVPLERSFALSSSGWLFVYYVGVVKALAERGYDRSAKIYGTSGGALTGCLLFLNVDMDALAEYVYICAAKARSSVRGAFMLRNYCRGAITQFCPQDAHKRLEGRFEISITRLFPWYKNLRVNTFPTLDFLIQSLLCSACITPLAGLPMWLKGHGLCFDGGVSDLQLLSGLARNGTFCKLHCRKTNPKDLVVVCPFYSSRADIRPSKYVPLWWAFYPPQPYKLKELFELGYKDTLKWCDKQEEESPSSSPRDSRAGSCDEDDEKVGGVAREEKEERTRRRERRARSASGGSGSEEDDLQWEWQRREGAGATARPKEGSSGAASSSSVKEGNSENIGEALKPSVDGGLTEWAAECQEWASLSAEAAARRAVRAARIAASKADQFMHHEAEVAMTYASAGFCEAQAAAEAMRRAATRQVGKAAEYAHWAADAGDDLAETIEGVHTGRFQLHRLMLKWIACLIIYFELLCQAGFYAAGAAAALLLPGVSSEQLWGRCVEFCRPLPRVLLQPVPGVRVGAKVNGRTAKVLGNISVTYRVLCYLVHMEVKI